MPSYADLSYFNSPTGTYIPVPTGEVPKDKEKSYTGSSGLASLIPGLLTGGASVISALKGNPANVTNVYGTNPNSPAPNKNNTWVTIGVGVAVVVVLLIVMKGGGAK